MTRSSFKFLFILIACLSIGAVQVQRFPSGTAVLVCQPSDSNSNCGGGGTGNVVGPSSAVDSNFTAFNSTTGKLIKDSGYNASSFATAAQGSLAASAYQKPGGGIPSSDMATAVQTSLGKADSALQSVTAHNLLSATHGDSAAGSVVRGDIMYGNATPKWDRLAFPATPTGKVIQATATDVGWSSSALGSAAFTASTDYATSIQGGKADTAIQTELDPIVVSQTIGFSITRGTTPKTLTVPLDASVSGTNTGDQVGDGSTVTGAGVLGDPFVAHITGGGITTLTGDNSVTTSSTPVTITGTGGIVTSVSGDTLTVDGSGISGGGANVTLSNLTSPTAINQNLIFANGEDRTIKVADQTTTDADGNSMSILAGAGNGSGYGGTLSLAGGVATAQAARVDLYGGDSDDTGYGGNFEASGGVGSTNGGDVRFTAGSGNNATSSGGNVLFQAGNSVTDGNGGNINLITGGAGSNSGNPGNIIINSTPAISASGTVCTITEITNGIITGGSCS